MTLLQRVDPLLAIKDLHVRRDGAQVVRGVTIRVFAGTIASIFGPNGAGKTSLLLAAARLIASDGEIVFEGRRMDGYPPGRLAREGLVYAGGDRSVFERLTVRENLAMGAWKRRDRYAMREEIAAILERFPDLARRTNAQAFRLSAAERRLLAIGRALMAKPRMLLLDEPSAGLPPERVAELFVILARLNSEGLPILLAEQYERKALAISDYAYFMRAGRVAFEGVPRELRAEPEIADAHIGTAHP